MCDRRLMQPDKSQAAAEPSPTQLVIDVKCLPDGRLEGTMHRADASRPMAFSGTLELLKTLEDMVRAPAAGEDGHRGLP